jgi:hypothetical protein
MASHKTGDWDTVSRILVDLSAQTKQAARKAMLREAHFLRGKMVSGLREQAPGGKTFHPLSGMTLASRRLKGFKGTKALIVHGFLRNAIGVQEHGSAIFIGVSRTAREKTGDPKSSIINVAEIQEFGAGPIIIPFTPKVRRYLGALLRELHGDDDVDKPFLLVRSKHIRFLVVNIPARPFVRPVFDTYGQPADVKKRLEENLAVLLKGKLSK